jgi:hypothetical protein
MTYRLSRILQTTAEFMLRKRMKARNFENLIRKDCFVSPLVRNNGQAKSKNTVYIRPPADITISNLILLFAGLEGWHFVQCQTRPKIYRNSSQHKWLKTIFQGLNASTHSEIGVNWNILVAQVTGVGKIWPKTRPFSMVTQVGYEHKN